MEWLVHRHRLKRQNNHPVELKLVLQSQPHPSYLASLLFSAFSLSFLRQQVSEFFKKSWWEKNISAAPACNIIFYFPHHQLSGIMLPVRQGCEKIVLFPPQCLCFCFFGVIHKFKTQAQTRRFHVISHSQAGVYGGGGIDSMREKNAAAERETQKDLQWQKEWRLTQRIIITKVLCLLKCSSSETLKLTVGNILKKYTLLTVSHSFNPFKSTKGRFSFFFSFLLPLCLWCWLAYWLTDWLGEGHLLQNTQVFIEKSRIRFASIDLRISEAPDVTELSAEWRPT